MLTSLRQRIDDLASSFVSELLATIRGASLQDLSGASSNGERSFARSAPTNGTSARAPTRRGGRLPRRSADDIAHVVDTIVALLRQTPKGLRAEQIREKLDLQAKELPRPLGEALDSGRVAKSGQKRATTYFVKGAGAAAAKPAAAKQKRRGPAARRGRTNTKRSKAVKAVEKKVAAAGVANSEVQT
jgi:hypothetical protein